MTTNDAPVTVEQCSCMEVHGENPNCPVHGWGTAYERANVSWDVLAAQRAEWRDEWEAVSARLAAIASAPAGDGVEDWGEPLLPLPAERIEAPRLIASELRRIANVFAEGLRMPSFLRDAADEMDRVADEREAALASAPAGKLDRDFTARRIKELMEEGDGFWRACSGCQEGVDGYVSERDYPFDPLFRCQPGGGCSECGGIGVLWEDGRGYADITGDEEPGRPLGLDVDGMCDDHQRFGCETCAAEFIKWRDRPRAAGGEEFLTQLRRVNAGRYQAWVGDGQDAGILFDAAELGGEVGELLNVVKKLEREDRGWRGSRAAPGDFADECADVLICLDKLARRKGVDLAAATVAKFNATSAKVDLPHRLTLQSPPAKVEG